MMIKNTNLQLSNQYQKKIAVFSDIHYTKNYSNKRLESIYQNVKVNHPDYICIVGDLFDQGNILEDQVSKYRFINWLKKLSNLAPVIIAIGNHDCMIYSVKREYRYPYELLEEISLLPNIHVLNNTVFQDQQICFIGYTLPYEYYYNDHEDSNKYASDFYETISPLLSKNTYNIVLCHTPIFMTDSSVTNMDCFRSINLILSGHMHNGIVPITIPGTYGIISPYKKFFPKYARGNFQINQVQYYISGGIIAFSNLSPTILHPLNVFFPIHIEYLSI